MKFTSLLPLLTLTLACGSKSGGVPPEVAASLPIVNAPAATSVAELPPHIQAVVDAPDRSAEDRALDAGRHPAATLAFFGIQPGMRVAELGAGGGYTAELLARTVGPAGKVYGTNAKFILERFAEVPWSARLAKPVNGNVVRVDSELGDPLPSDAQELDAVFLLLLYHDTFWLDVDRDAMNRAIYAALKPGGVYAVIDHSGRPGTVSTEAKTLHRVEESVVKEEIARAGFQLAGEASFLRNPDDPRDWNASPTAAGERRGQSDRFVLKFVKP